jgi:hypothetical protein
MPEPAAKPHSPPAPQDWERLLAEARQRDGGPFSPGPGIVFIVVSLAVATIAICVSDDGWVPVLDSANLVFHEAGHPIFGILGNTLALYGGTLGQLVFPITAIVSFQRRGHDLGLALGWVWLLQNFLNIARYMADARAHELPLVGGGEHDWTHIFTRWGVLSSDTSIAGFVQFIAWIGLLTVWGWSGLRWLQSRDRVRAARRRMPPPPPPR